MSENCLVLFDLLYFSHINVSVLQPTRRCLNSQTDSSVRIDRAATSPLIWHTRLDIQFTGDCLFTPSLFTYVILVLHVNQLGIRFFFNAVISFIVSCVRFWLEGYVSAWSALLEKQPWSIAPDECSKWSHLLLLNRWSSTFSKWSKFSSLLFLFIQLYSRLSLRKVHNVFLISFPRWPSSGMTLTGPHSSLLGSLGRARVSPSDTSMTLMRMGLCTGSAPTPSQWLCPILTFWLF